MSLDRGRRGRVYQSIRCAVNPNTGAVGNALIDRSWYGTVHAYEFDQLGRPIYDRIATLAGGAVRRIGWTYEVRGLVEKTTSYDDPTVGMGNVVNEVLAEYNDLQLLAKEYQEHSGAKNANTP